MTRCCAGCSVAEAAPQQGAVRLVALSGTVTPTAACDAAHIGGVELFNRGRWGRLRVHRNDFLTAQVVCRQLGFPFWSLYSTGSGDPTPAGPQQPRVLVWRGGVRCTGQETRLDECVFEKGVLGAGNATDIEAAGVFDRKDSSHLGVVCRRFEITGAGARQYPTCQRECVHALHALRSHCIT